MLFNSPEFLFGFLPVALGVFFLLGRLGKGWALAWLIAASLFFYAWWRPVNVFIILPAVAVNFGFARLLQRLGDEERVVAGKIVLAVAIAANVAFLGYFKYVNFAKETFAALTGADVVIAQIVLPLGISFITFQKIAFLIDVHARRVQSVSARDFLLFILFFPQLIAGPIVHFRETMPQFARSTCRLDRSDVSVGLTLLAIGLFKKVVLADGMAIYVTPIYDLAGSGGAVTLLPAWLAAVGFTLQIYFDFSAYSDMATGLARCVGIRLPLNFDSPLKASSIIDFWNRWHVTLTRFLTAYIYNPLLLTLTRRRLARGQPGLRGGRTTPGAFILLLAGPTLLTMVVSGLWHGAGFTFIVWGAVHGVYLTINHAWRMLSAKLDIDWKAFGRPAGVAAVALTFVSVSVAMVLFRSPDAVTATEILRGLFGANGIAMPEGIVGRLGPLAQIIAADSQPLLEFVTSFGWLGALLFIALALPNSLELMSKFDPVLGMEQRERDHPALFASLRWSPTLVWGVFVSCLVAAAVLRLGGPSEFLYWQF